LSLRRAVFQIFDFKNVLTLKFGSEVTQGHRNRDGSIRHQLMLHSNHKPISYSFWDKRRKSQKCQPPVYLTPPLRGSPWNWVTTQFGSIIK